MINNPVPLSEANIPRGAVYANGVLLLGLVSFEVDNNNFFQADTFRVTLALSGQPSDQDFDWWSRQDQLEIELFLGYPANPDRFTKSELTSYLVGYVDDIEFDPICDTITLAGRDLTSKLIDYKRAIAFTSGNLIASDIVTQIANERGLTPVVTKTSVAAGTYTQIVKSLITSEVTYWDIITRLAQMEGFQAYVKGRELHFEPRTAPDADPYVIRYKKPQDDIGYIASNAMSLKFSRNLSIARDLKVRVLSVHPKTGKRVEETADRKRVRNHTTGSVARSQEPPLEYVRRFPQLTPEQAQKKAQSLLEELSRHEVNLHAELPGDLLLTAQHIVKVEGTGTAFDQTYYASSITRSYSMDGGFRMRLSAKNQTPNQPA